jgi:oligosaccharide repeat unit polymerase
MSPNGVWRPAWWLEPARFTLLVVLPFFLAATILGPSGFLYYGNFLNNITPYTILLGVASILAFSAGALTVTLFGPSSSQTLIHSARGTNALRILGVIAIVTYLIFLSPFLVNIDLVFALLSGNATAMYEARETAERLPGITSFMQVAVVFCSVFAALRLDPNYRLPTDVRLIFAVLIFLVICRTLLYSERLALIEFLVALFLSQIAFRWRPSLLRATSPLWAIVALCILFALGEYFRSWQFYQYQGFDSYFQFVLVRFVGYFSTAINNATGILLNFDPLGYPANTAKWFYKMLQVLGAGPTNQADIVYQYLTTFANPEFNNVSGLYSPFIDFGLVVGLMVVMGVGAISGLLYRSFLRLQPAGLIIYPTWYVGLLDFIRIFYWGESRYIPVFVPAVCVVWFVRMSTKKQRSGPARTRLLPSVEGRL